MPTPSSLSRSINMKSNATKLILVIVSLVIVILVYKYVVKRRKNNSEYFEDFAPVTVNAFFMPGCGHCTAFKPEWKKFTQSKPSFVTANEYSSDKDMDKCEEYNVSGFPTIIIEKDGKRKIYEGKRTAEALTAACEEFAK